MAEHHMTYSDVKVGMVVKIVRRVAGKSSDSEGNEWKNTWVSGMDSFICDGKGYIVRSIGITGVRLGEQWSREDEFQWPWTALAPVEEVVQEKHLIKDLRVRVAHKTEFSWGPGMDECVGKIGKVGFWFADPRGLAVLVMFENGAYFFLANSLTIPFGVEVPKKMVNEKEVEPVFKLIEEAHKNELIELKKVWVSHSLNEIYSSNQWKFAVLTSKNEMATPWVMCRDYIADCYSSHMFNKPITVHGLSITPSTHPKPFFGKVRLAITHDKESMFDKLAIAKHIVHLFEGSMRIKKSKVLAGNYKIDEHHEVRKCFIIEASRFWLTSPALLSLYSLLWRCGENFTITEAKQIKTTAQFLAAMKNCKVNNKNKGYICSLVDTDKKEETFLRVIRSHRTVFKDYPAEESFNMVGHWKGDTYKFHNDHGVVSFFSRKYPNINFNNKHILPQ